MSENTQWIIRPELRPAAALRLFCFPYAGVGASAFRGWARQIGNDVEVCCIELPGRESRLRERPIPSLKELLPPLVENIWHLLDRPYAFYGHSFGAKLAFETARKLRSHQARTPAHLFISACQAPHLPWQHSPMRFLETEAFLAEIQTRYGGIPKQILEDRELIALLLPALRADITALETYSYASEPPLECPLTVFGGLEDAMVDERSLRSWQIQTTGAFQLQMFPGDHFFYRSAAPTLFEMLSRVAAGRHAGAPVFESQFRENQKRATCHTELAGTS